MIVVADAGRLIALAKIGGLDLLFRLVPKILIPPAVYREAIATSGGRRPPDALALQACWQGGKLETAPPADLPLPVAARLGRGETEAILLAIERRAKWVLMDDLAARHAAAHNFRAAQVPTVVKGTLGVLASLTLAATTEPQQLLAGLERLRMPNLLVQIMGFMVRYLEVVTSELHRMRIAREFIQKGSVEGLDASCVESLKRPPFFLTPAGPDPGGAKGAQP